MIICDTANESFRSTLYLIYHNMLILPPLLSFDLIFYAFPQPFASCLIHICFYTVFLSSFLRSHDASHHIPSLSPYPFFCLVALGLLQDIILFIPCFRNYSSALYNIVPSEAATLASPLLLPHSEVKRKT